MQLVKAALCAALYPNVVKVIIPPDKMDKKGRKRLRKEDVHFHVRREPDEDSDEDDDEDDPAMKDGTPEGQLLAVLRRFQSGTETAMEFPASLSKAQRKFAHNEAQRMGMKSKSVGKEGVNRRLTVHQEPKGEVVPSSEVHIHPSSVNSRTIDFLPFLVFLEKVGRIMATCRCTQATHFCNMHGVSLMLRAHRR
jgi:hypothetical protein